MNTYPHAGTVVELNKAYQEGRSDPPRATEAYLSRAEAHAHLHAYTVLDREGALAAAKAVAEPRDRSPERGLAGIPVAVKDNVAVAGLPLRAGSKVFRGFVPSKDAEVVTRLREAGAVILGKLSLHELGLGNPVDDGPFATGVHPWNPAYYPGGSSSGSGVAVAAGLCPLAVGTDTGGSVRGPASSCGVVGLKPTYGLVPLGGVVPLCWSMDHVGFFTRTVADMTMATQALGLTDPSEPSKRTGPPRIGYLDEGQWGDLDPVVEARFRQLLTRLEEAGATLVAVRLVGWDETGPAWQARLIETYMVHASDFMRDPEQFSPAFRGILDQGQRVTSDAYEASWHTASRFRSEVDEALNTVDVLCTPTAPSPAIRVGQWEGLNVFNWYRFLFPFNLSGHPAISLPYDRSLDGVPLGVQLIGRRGQDGTLLETARWCEEVVDYPVRVAGAPL